MIKLVRLRLVMFTILKNNSVIRSLTKIISNSKVVFSKVVPDTFFDQNLYRNNINKLVNIFIREKFIAKISWNNPIININNIWSFIFIDSLFNKNIIKEKLGI